MKNYAQIDDKDCFIYRFPLVSGKKSGHKFISQEHKLIKKTFCSRLINTFIVSFVLRGIKKTKSLVLPILPSSKKLRQYATNQLEKLHPCYSQQDVFTVRRSADGKTVEAAVIDKRKLAEYRARYRSRRLYVTKKLSFPGKPVISQLLVVGCVCGGIVAFFIFQFLVKSVEQNDIPIKNETLLVNERSEQNIEKSTEVEKESVLSEILVLERFQLFFDKLYEYSKKPGIVEQITITENFLPNNIVSCNTEVLCRKFFPDELLSTTKQSNFSVNVPEISYNDKREPSFTIYAQSVQSGSILPEAMFDDANQVTFLQSFRQTVSRHNGEVIREDYQNHSVSFRLLLADLSRCMSALVEDAKNSNCSLKKLSIKKDNLECNVLLEYTAQSEIIGISSCIDKISRLFRPSELSSKNTVIKEQKENTDDIEMNDNGLSIAKNGNQKVGEIKTKDGMNVVFYKTTEGKIITEQGDFENENKSYQTESQ